MKKYIIRCSTCRWTQNSDGSKESVNNLYETTACAKCRKRTFRCPKCGFVAKMFELKK